MELLDDIIDSSDGENTPPVWISKQPIEKSNRYGNTALQDQSSNVDILHDKDDNSVDGLLDAVSEQSWADSTLIADVLPEVELSSVRDAQPGVRRTSVDSDAPSDRSDDEISLPGNTRYLEQDKDENALEADNRSQASKTSEDGFVVEDKFCFNDFRYKLDDVPIASAGRYNFDDVPIASAGRYNFDHVTETRSEDASDFGDLPDKICAEGNISDMPSDRDDFSSGPDPMSDLPSNSMAGLGASEELPVHACVAPRETPNSRSKTTGRRITPRSAVDDALSRACGRDASVPTREPTGTAASFSSLSHITAKSEAVTASATTIGDADTAASPATTSTAPPATVDSGAPDVEKKPFLRKGARLASTLRSKGAPISQYTTPSRTASSKILTLTRGNPSARDLATPSASSTRPSTPPAAAQSSAAATGRSAPMASRNHYKEAYSQPATEAKNQAPSMTKSPRDLMWDDDSADDRGAADDKLSFMDFMRDKGLSNAEFQRMEARTQHHRLTKTPDFGADPPEGVGAGGRTRDKITPAGRDLFDDSAQHARTVPLPAKKGFREYYREKFGGDGECENGESAFPGLCAAVGTEERTEKRAFRSLYHNDGSGTSLPSRDNARTDTVPKKAETSYATLWQEEVAKKNERRWDEWTEPSSERELFDKDTAPVSSLVRKHFYKESPKAKTPPKKEPSSPKHDEEMGHLLQQKLTLLDAQIARFKKENEQCKKLRLEREQALRDAERDREKMQAELANERDMMRAELEEDHEKLRRERKRVEQDRERHRQQLSQSRADQDEVTTLRQQVGESKEDFAQKEQRWRRTVERLQKQNDELKKKCQEANDEIAWAQKGAAPATRRATPTPSTKSAIPSTSEKGKSRTLSAPTISARTAPVFNTNSTGAKPTKPQKSSDGRIERTHSDGSREIEFPNGLKKVLHLDGSCLVQFANGDTKECRNDGYVIYRYHGTRATQTTLPDKTEIYEFSSGQVETHYTDGSKEITFPNGTIKHIAADGTENISFSNAPKPSLNA